MAQGPKKCENKALKEVFTYEELIKQFEDWKQSQPDIPQEQLWALYH